MSLPPTSGRPTHRRTGCFDKSRLTLFQRPQMVKKEIEKGAAARSSSMHPLFRLGSTRRKVGLGARFLRLTRASKCSF